MSYQPPSQYSNEDSIIDKSQEIDKESLLNLSTRASSVIKKHPKHIELQKVESTLKEYSLLQIFLSIAVLYALAMMIYDFTVLGSLQTTIDIIIKVTKLIGYGYGLQAYSSKVYWQWCIFFYYSIVYFFVIGYYTYMSYDTVKWVYFGLNIASFVLNIVIVIWAKRFGDNLKKRDELKRDLMNDSAVIEESQRLAL